jgi:hypothetical protein
MLKLIRGWWPLLCCALVLYANFPQCSNPNGFGSGNDKGSPSEDSEDTGDEPDWENFSQNCDSEPPEDFDQLVHEAGKAWGVNPRLIVLTVYRESRCMEGALGASGEIGLGQINPSVWESHMIEVGLIKSKEDLWNPRKNLEATAYVLREAYRYADGNVKDAVRRYNGSGPRARKYAQEQVQRYRELWSEDPWLQDGC